MGLYRCTNHDSVMYMTYTGICCEDECPDGEPFDSTERRRTKMGEMCNDCCLPMHNCDDMSICCEVGRYEGERCDWFVPMPEQEDKND